MTVSMREILARALVDKLVTTGAGRAWGNPRNTVVEIDDAIDMLDIADAVLEVLAEPDEGMIAAGNDEVCQYYPETCDTPGLTETTVNAWTSMLKAARSPAKED